MAIQQAALPTENLDNISETQMMMLAEQMNALEPGADSSQAQTITEPLNMLPMLDAMDFFSISCLLAVAVYLSIPMLRNLHKKLSLIGS